MPRTYEHINQYEREQIANMIKIGHSWIDIGRQICRPASTAWREYHRNREADGVYLASKAQIRCIARRTIPRRPLMCAGDIKQRVTQGLRRYWSPEQIAGRAESEGYPIVSPMTMYRFIQSDQGAAYRGYLRGPTKEVRRRRVVFPRIHERTMIDDRPREVGSRKKVGHWEADTVRGPMKTSTCIVTVVERASRYLVARILPERQAAHLNRAMDVSMKQMPLKTLTVDNGMEFASHKKLTEKTGAAVYFAHEKSPWERGQNEYTNKLLRQFIPKGVDIARYTAAQLRGFVSRINNRPRKCLKYQTPIEVLNKLSLCT